MNNLFPLGDFNVNSQQQADYQNNHNQSAQIDFRTFNIDHFFELMKSINAMSESDLISTIKNYIDLIVDRTLSDDKTIGSILSHPKFVAAYYKTMQIIPIDYERRLFANKLTYEYSVLDNPNPDILRYFREISEYVNKDTTIKLVNIGLNRRIANDLVMCRYSSRHESVNVQRLNFTMCKYNAEIFTDQMIVWVYEQLFDRISDLFISSMLEVYSDRELDELGNEFRDVYGNISLAILIILNNMPSISIRMVILKYIDAYTEWVKVRHTLPRFTLRALSYDYERIVNVVEELITKGYDIP